MDHNATTRVNIIREVIGFQFYNSLWKQLDNSTVPPGRIRLDSYAGLWGDIFFAAEGVLNE